MDKRTIEILALKLAQAEANASILQAQAEELQQTNQELQNELNQLKGFTEVTDNG